MKTSRLEAFSDGVIAILITIMVLELHVPHGDTLAALQSMLPLFATYLLSFVILGIYWNNHHHLFQVTEDIDGTVLWANLHLLFWLSLIPFVTAWMGQNHYTSLPTAAYGFDLLMCAVAYTLLQTSIIAHQGARSTLAQAVGRDKKGKISALLYVMAVPLAFVHRGLAWGIFVFVALLWLLPDRRIESKLHRPHGAERDHQ